MPFARRTELVASNFSRSPAGARESPAGLREKFGPRAETQRGQEQSCCVAAVHIRDEVELEASGGVVVKRHRTTDECVESRWRADMILGADARRCWVKC